MYVHHMFLICSSVGGHLCCLHFLVVVSDSGSKHGCVRIPVVGLYILYAYASSGLARSYSVISSVFSCLQSQRVDLHSLCIYIPTLGQHWFLFLMPPWCSPQPFLVLQVLAGMSLLVSMFVVHVTLRGDIPLRSAGTQGFSGVVCSCGE